MKPPKLLDLFCGAGGAAMGYHRAGFDVVGVDNRPQPRYPFRFVQADALEYLARFGREYDVIHASPPCQAYSAMRHVWKAPTAYRSAGTTVHPELVEPTRDGLRRTGRPYVIENVIGAPLLHAFALCGTMFGLQVFRHRLFECSELILIPNHARHTARAAAQGRRPKEGQFMTVTGHFADQAFARRAMGIDWMNRAELAQAIPPAYTEHIGRQLVGVVVSGSRDGAAA